MWADSRTECTLANSGVLCRACMYLKLSRHHRINIPACITFWGMTSTFYCNHILCKESYFKGISEIKMQSSLPPPHSIHPKLHLIPVLSFSWAPILKLRVCGGWHKICLSTGPHFTSTHLDMSCHDRSSRMNFIQTSVHTQGDEASSFLFSVSANDCLHLDLKTPQVAGIVGDCQTQCLCSPCMLWR